MRHRTFVITAALAVFAAMLPAQIPAGWTPPRTTDGHPDLEGIWTNATITPLERPPQFAGKPAMTDAEAAVFEKSSAAELASVDGKSEHPLLAAAGSNGTGGYNILFIDRGSELARVDGVKRTSLIIDPPDGKIPPLTPEARKNFKMEGFGRFDSIKDRPLSERCLLGFGSTSGPPMLPVLYNNNYQIVETPDYVMILVEMVHDARIIRMHGQHPDPSVRQWLGDSIGHWEGDTLVVETTNFSKQVRFHGSSEHLRVIERFTRTAPGTIQYRATIDDPTVFTKPWTIAYPFSATKGPIYEYACHEGNYAEADILGGARKRDAEAARK